MRGWLPPPDGGATMALDDEPQPSPEEGEPRARERKKPSRVCCLLVLLRRALVWAICNSAFPVTATLLTFHKRPHYVLMLLYVIVALCSLEMFWLLYRIRGRFLRPFLYEELSLNAVMGHVAGADATGGHGSGDANATPEASQRTVEVVPVEASNVTVFVPCEVYDSEQKARLNVEMAVRCVISGIADQFFFGSRFAAALVVATIGAGLSGVVSLAAEPAMFLSKHRRGGWRLLLAATCWCTWLALMCGSMLSTRGEAFVVMVYQLCVLIASMNSYLVYFSKDMTSMDLVDSSAVLLIGVCTVVTFRIGTSREVFKSLFTVVFDMFVAVVVVAPTLLLADFFDHSMSVEFTDIVCNFVVVTWCSQLGGDLGVSVVKWFKRKGDGRHLSRSFAGSPCGVGQYGWRLFGAMPGAVIGILACVTIFPRHEFDQWETLALGTAVVTSQLSMVLISHLKDLADVKTTAYVHFPLLEQGFLEHLMVFLIGGVAYHPYIKWLFTARELAED